jgi:uncharacterized tellurite resistance protein B-like protein
MNAKLKNNTKMTEMTPTENLHYAIGEIAYAIARADGEIQKEERLKFHNIVEAALRCNDFDFNISDIIFQILDKDHLSTAMAYDWAMGQLKINSHYLSPHLKATFIKVIEKIAKAYPPVTMDEMNLITRFKKDIEPLIGDPVYYERSNYNY